MLNGSQAQSLLLPEVVEMEEPACDRVEARAAELAFAQHPLVDSTRTAATLLTDYRRAIPALDAVFTGRT